MKIIHTIIASLLALSPCGAVPVTYTFEGTIPHFLGRVLPGFHDNIGFSGSFEFDLDTLTAPAPEVEGDLQVDIGQYHFRESCRF
jgi:hypothetical protein